MITNDYSKLYYILREAPADDVAVEVTGPHQTIARAIQQPREMNRALFRVAFYPHFDRLEYELLVAHVQLVVRQNRLQFVGRLLENVNNTLSFITLKDNKNLSLSPLTQLSELDALLQYFRKISKHVSAALFLQVLAEIMLSEFINAYK